MRHGNMTTLGWTCHTRAAPSCDMFNLGSSYFHVALTTVRHLLNGMNAALHSASPNPVLVPLKWQWQVSWYSWPFSVKDFFLVLAPVPPRFCLGPNKQYRLFQASTQKAHVITCLITSYSIWSHDYVCRTIWSFCSYLSCFFHVFRF